MLKTPMILKAIAWLVIGLGGFSNAASPPDKIDDKMFPDGESHDFGIVQRGAQLYHAFRIVNTSDVPMKIVSVRLS